MKRSATIPLLIILSVIAVSSLRAQVPPSHRCVRDANDLSTAFADSRNLSRFTAQGTLYFSVWGAPGAQSQVWYSTGGTAQPVSTSLLAYVNTDPYADMNGRVLFDADDGVNGREPWVIYGASMYKLTDVVAGSDGVGDVWTMTTDNGISYFSVNTYKFKNGGGGGYTGMSSFLYKTDWTTVGTVKLTAWSATGGSAGAYGMRAVNGKPLFLAGVTTGTQGVYTTDGTKAGTKLIKSATVLATGVQPAVMNGKYYFVATDATYGRELWLSDGTAAGTKIAADVNPGTVGSDPNYLIALNGKLYFTAQHATYGRALFAYDPAQTNPATAATLVPGMASSIPMWLTAAGGKLFFSALTDGAGRELCYYAPGASGITVACDIYGGTGSSDPHYGIVNRPDQTQEFTIFGSHLYFGATDGLTPNAQTGGGPTKYQMWRYDFVNCPASAELVPGFDLVNTSYPNSFITAGNKLYYLAFDPAYGNRVYVYDPYATKIAADPLPSVVGTLGVNHPNPFNGMTELPYTLAEDADVRLVVTDMLGREVAVLVSGLIPRGVHSARFDASRLPAGTYVARLDAAGAVHTRLLQLVR